MSGLDDVYTPQVPTPEQVDKAIDGMRRNHPSALERPDYIDGMLGAFAAINLNVRSLVERRPDVVAHPLADLLLQSFSQNLGDNFELYRAVRDTLYPLEGGETGPQS